MFSIESSEVYSSCRVRGQKNKLSYRHAELGAVKVKIGTFRPAPGPQKREDKNAFLFFLAQARAASRPGLCEQAARVCDT